MVISYWKCTRNRRFHQNWNRIDFSSKNRMNFWTKQTKKVGEEEENKKIFQELNHTVVQKQLYLSPELSREDLAQIVHLNNARFARMIRECTGTNFNGYINGLRINYAIKLMKKIS